MIFIKSDKLISSMKFELMDPKYTEKKFIISNFPLENYTETTKFLFLT
jgi:hypothetical protein